MHQTDRLYDRNFLIAFLSQTCFVCANTLMAHYARWIEFLGGDLRQVGLVMGGGDAWTTTSALDGAVDQPDGGPRHVAAGLHGVCCSVGSQPLLERRGSDDLRGPIGPSPRHAIVFASGLTYVSQTSPDHRRTEAIGVFGIGGFLGMLLGPLMGDLFLADRERANFVALFLVAAAANVLPAMGVFLLRDSDRQGRGSSVRLKEFVRVVRRHWPGLILLVDFAFGVCMTAPFIFVASFIDHASLHLKHVSVIGLFFFCYAGLGIVVRLWSRRLPDRIGARRVLLVGMCFMSLGMLSFGWVTADRVWLIMVPAFLAGIGHSLMFHTMTSLTLENFPSEVRGTGSALALMMLDLGTIAGAPVLGLIGERYGYAALFATIGLLCLSVGVAYAASRIRLAAAKLAANVEPVDT